MSMKRRENDVCFTRPIYGPLTLAIRVSRYYLEDKDAAARAALEEKRRKDKEAKAKSAAAARAKQAEEAKLAAAARAKQAEEAKAKSAAAARAKQAEAAVKAAKPGATISLFGFGQQEPDAGEAPPSKPRPGAAAKKAPRGVPMIIKWKRRGDGKRCQV